MARSRHSNHGSDRFERQAKRGHRPTERRASTKRQVILQATR